MKINTDSWHFKLYKEWSSSAFNFELGYKSLSLCKYFWSVVLAVIATILMALMPLVAIGFLAWMIWDLIGWWTLMIIPSIVGFLGLAALIGYIIERKKYSGPQTKTKEPTPDTLVTSYIKAKKQKVCPLLEPDSNITDQNDF